MSPALVSAEHLRFISFTLRQFVISVPSLSIISLWGLLALEEPSHERLSASTVQTMAAALQKLSGWIALQGLFVLYKVSHDVLHPWRTTLKFVAVKFVILLDMVQKLVVRAVVARYESQDAESGGLERRDVCQLRGEERIVFWTNFLLVFETVIMAALCQKAFPADELQEATGATDGVGISDVDLERVALKSASSFGSPMS